MLTSKQTPMPRHDKWWDAGEKGSGNAPAASKKAGSSAKTSSEGIKQHVKQVAETAAEHGGKAARCGALGAVFAPLVKFFTSPFGKVVAAAQVLLFVATQIDLTVRSGKQVNGSKWLWRLASFIDVLGPLAYFRFGRNGKL